MAQNLKIIMTPLQPDEAGAVFSLFSQCFERPWSKAEIAKTLAASGAGGFSLSQASSPGGKLIGAVLYRVAAAEAELYLIAVTPQHRRKGYAQRLLCGMLEDIKGRDVKKIFLEVNADNLAARTLYQLAGFAEVGRRTTYYRGQSHKSASGADAVVLALDLDIPQTGPGGLSPL